MSDAYQDVRTLPLLGVLAALGHAGPWKPRKGGQEHSGPCPIHRSQKNRTSFSFDASGKYFCFSCQQKGRGAIDLVAAVKQVGFRDAVEVLKGLNVQQTEGFAQDHKTQIDEPVTENPPVKLTYSKYFVESRWLSERGFSPETLEKFGVGEYSNPKRPSAYKGKIMLPVRRWDGELVAYLARTKEPKESEPKYVWPKGFLKSLELFGAWELKNAHAGAVPIRRVFLVESPFAVMKFAQLGCEAVSPFGWTVSPEQAATLARLAKGCIWLPDRNKREDAVKVAGLLSQYLWTKMPEMPADVCDPEQLTEQQIRSLA